MSTNVYFTASVDRDLLKQGSELQNSVVFFPGRINDLTAMESLGLESEEDLFLMMAQTCLPMPKLSDSVTRGVVDDLNSLIP